MDFEDYLFQLVDFLIFFLVCIVHHKSTVFRQSRIFPQQSNKLETAQFPAKKKKYIFHKSTLVGKSNIMTRL
jgi:hypothetical protein